MNASAVRMMAKKTSKSHEYQWNDLNQLSGLAATIMQNSNNIEDVMHGVEKDLSGLQASMQLIEDAQYESTEMQKRMMADMKKKEEAAEANAEAERVAAEAERVAAEAQANKDRQDMDRLIIERYMNDQAMMSKKRAVNRWRKGGLLERPTFTLALSVSCILTIILSF